MKTRIVQNEPNDPVRPRQSSDPDERPPTTWQEAPALRWNRFRGFVRRYELVIFFALSYLIAWSTLPFGSFLAFAPMVSAIIVVSRRRGLAGAGSAGSAPHSVAGELDLVRGRHRPAAAGPRRGDRSEHGGRRTCPVADPVPAVVRGAAAVRPSDGESHRRATWERSRPGVASLSRGCNRSGHPWRRPPCSGC